MKKVIFINLMCSLLAIASFAQSNCVSTINSETCVTFNVVEHGIENPELYIFHWDFGDGQKDIGSKITHCYEVSGSFTAKLSLTNIQNGAFFEDELDVDVQIKKAFVLGLNIPDTVYHGTDFEFNIAIGEGDASNIETENWEVNGESFSNRFDAMKSMKLGLNQVRSNLLLKSGIELCSEKEVLMLPSNEFEFESRYLKDRVHHSNDSLIWSGNMIVHKGSEYKINPVFFQLDDMELTETSKKTLEENVRLLRTFTEFKIQVGSFTHSEGDYELNRKLSVKRSEVVKKYLISKGLSKDQIEVADPDQYQSLKNTCSDFLDCSYVDEKLNLRTDIKLIQL